MRTSRHKKPHSHDGGGGVTHPPDRTLTVNKAGTGVGQITAAGIDTGAPWRGGPISQAVPSAYADIAALGLSWFYNYSKTPGSYAGNVPFVPMIFNGPAAGGNLSALNGTADDYLLGFNEPDGAGANHLTYTQALDLWPNLMATGRSLGSPANIKGAGGDSWRHDFFAGAKTRGYQIDFICIHWYDPTGTPADLVNYLTTVRNNMAAPGAYGQLLPVWLTEFARYNGTVTQNVNFIQAAGPLLAALPWLKRVGWFPNRNIPGGPWANAGLCTSTGALSPVGAKWKAWPSHDDNTQTYPDGTTVHPTAHPDSKSNFISWSGALSGNVTPETLVMDANKTITGTFNIKPPGFNALPQYNVTDLWPNSPLRDTVPTTPLYDPNSDAFMAWLQKWGGTAPKLDGFSGLGGTCQDFSHPLYKASTSDPLWTVTGDTSYQSNITIRVPVGAMQAAFNCVTPPGAATLDKSMAILQPEGDTAIATNLRGRSVDLWGVTTNTGGTIDCGFYAISTPVLTGTGTNGGLTAAHFAFGLGIIRVDELLSGTISHALYVATHGYHGHVFPSWIPPAGQTTSGEVADLDAPPMGAWMHFPRSYLTEPFLTTPGRFPAFQQTILRCIREYGIYIGDYGGGPRFNTDGSIKAPFLFNAQLESETPYKALGRAPTCLQYLDTQTGHTPGTLYNMAQGVDWTKLKVLLPPNQQ